MVKWLKKSITWHLLTDDSKKNIKFVIIFGVIMVVIHLAIMTIGVVNSL